MAIDRKCEGREMSHLTCIRREPLVKVQSSERPWVTNGNQQWLEKANKIPHRVFGTTRVPTGSSTYFKYTGSAMTPWSMTWLTHESIDPFQTIFVLEGVRPWVSLESLKLNELCISLMQRKGKTTIMLWSTYYKLLVCRFWATFRSVSKPCHQEIPGWQALDRKLLAPTTRIISC